MNDKSRMKGDFHVRFREKFEVKVLLLTRLRGRELITPSYSMCAWRAHVLTECKSPNPPGNGKDNRETLEEVREMIRGFLEPRGLKLSAEKTLITHIDDGFDFLGRNFRKYKGKLIIKPSRKSVEKVTKAVSRIIKDNHTAPQETLIRNLNEVTKGWVDYGFPGLSGRTWQALLYRIHAFHWTKAS